MVWGVVVQGSGVSGLGIFPILRKDSQGPGKP